MLNQLRTILYYWLSWKYLPCPYYYSCVIMTGWDHVYIMSNLGLKCNFSGSWNVEETALIVFNNLPKLKFLGLYFITLNFFQINLLTRVMLPENLSNYKKCVNISTIRTDFTSKHEQLSRTCIAILSVLFWPRHSVSTCIRFLFVLFCFFVFC